MKYWIFKIIGILGLVFTPFIYLGYYDQYLAGINSRYMDVEWLYTYEALLIVFLIITIAGFARPIARLKALIDFHTDFDDDQELEDYPKLRIFAVVKRCVLWVAIIGFVVLAILANWVPALSKGSIYYLIASLTLSAILALVNIIICICKQINPIYADIGVLFAIIGVALFFHLDMWGVTHIVILVVTSPIFAIALLYLAFAADDLISADEVFDWVCADEYNEYYKKLCEKEKEQEAQKELSAHKQAKQNKIQVKQTKRAEKKETKQTQKTKKTQKDSK